MVTEVEGNPPARQNADSWLHESVCFKRLGEKNAPPLIIYPAEANIDLIAWATRNRDLLRQTLLTDGAILFRNFKVESAERFEQFIMGVSGELLPYTERSSPRSQVSGNIYTSTDHPPEQSIFLHNENSYQNSWPLKLFFYCQTPAKQGGETPIADTRRVLSLIAGDIRERFWLKKVLYVRNFGHGLGLPWQTVFQTNDRAVVETYCRNAGIEHEWIGGDHLRTRHVKDAITNHPVTGTPVWFNHMAFFHPTTLDRKTREDLLLVVDEEDLPYNTFYGDGAKIEAEVLDNIRWAYRQETIMFTWQASDILLLDNMMYAHGRSPFVGPRRILVGMSELYTPPKN